MIRPLPDEHPAITRWRERRYARVQHRRFWVQCWEAWCPTCPVDATTLRAFVAELERVGYDRPRSVSRALYSVTNAHRLDVETRGLRRAIVREIQARIRARRAVLHCALAQEKRRPGSGPGRRDE